MDLQRHLRPREAAQYLGLSEKTLANLRWRGGGPAYSKTSARCVLYRREDLDAWIEAHRRSSTSDAGAAPVAA